MFVSTRFMPFAVDSSLDVLSMLPIMCNAHATRKTVAGVVAGQAISGFVTSLETTSTLIEFLA